MLTRYTSVVLLAVAASLAAGTASAQSPSSQSSSTQSPAGASAQASGQAGASADRSGAAAQGATSSAASAHAGDHNASLANGSAVNAELMRPVDSRKSKPGDPVNARTTEPARTEDGRSIPKGSTLVGHVSEAHARGEGQADSAVGIVFDKAVTRDGHEIPLRNVGIRALAAAGGSAAASTGEAGSTMGAGAMGAGGMAAGRGLGGGGLVGRTAGGVGGTLGSGVGAAGGVTGSLAGSTTGALQAGPGAVGGLDASGLLTASSAGVFGLRDVSLSSAGSSTTQGSVVTSTGKSVHLDQGTRMLLSSQAGASGESHGGRDGDAPKPSGRPKDSKPDTR